MVAASRDVIYTIRTVYDESAIKMVERYHGAHVKAQESIRKETEKSIRVELKSRELSAKEQAKLLRQQEKEAERVFKANAKLSEKAEKAATQAADKQAKAAKKAADEQLAHSRRVLTQQLKDIETTAKFNERESAKSAARARQRDAEVERYSAKMVAANNMMAEGTKAALAGTLRLGRAVALLGVAGEEDMQKVVQVLARFQAMADLVTGTIDIVRGLSKAYRAVEASILAAAAANRVLAMSSAGAAGAGAVGAGVGGAAAAGAGVGLGGKIIGGIGGGIAAIGAVPAAIGVAGAAALTGGLYATNSSFRGMMDEGTAEMFGTEGSMSNQSNKRFEAYMQRQSAQAWQTRDAASMTSAQSQTALDSLGIDRARRTAGTASLGSFYGEEGYQKALRSRLVNENQSARSMASTQLQSSRSAYSSAHDEYNYEATAGDKEAATERMKSALETMVELEKERVAINRQIAEEGERGIRKQLEGAQQLASQMEGIARSERERFETAAQRFGKMNEVERSQAVEATRTLRQGGELTAEQRGLVERIGLEEDRQSLSDRDLRTARGTSGFSEIFGATEGRVRQAEQEAAELHIEMGELKTKLDVTITNNLKDYEKQMVDVLKPHFDQLSELLETKLTRALSSANQTRTAGL